MADYSLLSLLVLIVVQGVLSGTTPTETPPPQTAPPPAPPLQTPTHPTPTPQTPPPPTPPSETPPLATPPLATTPPPTTSDASEVDKKPVLVHLSLESPEPGMRDLTKALEGGKDIWTQEHLREHIRIRLVKKSWSPQGASCSSDGKFTGTPEEAFKSLMESRYTFEERPFSKKDELFTVKDESGKEMFDKNQPIIMIIHPLSGDADGNFISTTVTALALRNLHQTNNIVTVNMPGLAANMFITIMKTIYGEDPEYDPVAEALGDFFVDAINNKYTSAEKVNLIGWSYSGQLVGYMGRYIRAKTGQPIGTILAMDPVAEEINKKMKHLSSADARVVHVYHSNSFPCGTRQRRGTADFIINGGMTQPECLQDKNPFYCSHRHVVLRLWYVILYGETQFIARQCSAPISFNCGYCDNNPTTPMVYPIDKSDAKGKYFILTTEKRPFYLGEEGSRSAAAVRAECGKAFGTTGVDGLEMLTIMMMGRVAANVNV